MCPKILKRKPGFDVHRMMDSSTKDSMNIFSPQCQLSAWDVSFRALPNFQVMKHSSIDSQKENCIVEELLYDKKWRVPIYVKRGQEMSKFKLVWGKRVLSLNYVSSWYFSFMFHINNRVFLFFFFLRREGIVEINSVYRDWIVVKESTAFIARHQERSTGSLCSKNLNSSMAFR